MDGLGYHRAHPEGGLEDIRPGPKVLDRAHIFQRMPFFLQGVVALASPLDGDGGSLDLKGLLGLGGHLQRALHADGAASCKLSLDLLRQIILLVNHLYVLEAAAVRQLDKADCLAVPHGAYPARHLNRPRVLCRVFGNLTQPDHGKTSSSHSEFPTIITQHRPALQIFRPCAAYIP